MTMKKNGFFIVLISVALSMLSAFLVVKYVQKSNQNGNSAVQIERNGSAVNIDIVGKSFPDFTFAAENSVEAVVYVKVLKREKKSREASILEYFFGGPQFSQPRESVNSGSGVILYDDGYIVTNNHVVDGAVEVAVTLNNNKQYKAKTNPLGRLCLHANELRLIDPRTGEERSFVSREPAPFRRLCRASAAPRKKGV